MLHRVYRLLASVRVFGWRAYPAEPVSEESHVGRIARTVLHVLTYGVLGCKNRYYLRRANYLRVWIHGPSVGAEEMGERTMLVLEVTPATYAEIRALLTQAGYSHTLQDGSGEHQEVLGS